MNVISQEPQLNRLENSLMLGKFQTHCCVSAKVLLSCSISKVNLCVCGSYVALQVYLILELNTYNSKKTSRMKGGHEIRLQESSKKMLGANANCLQESTLFSKSLFIFHLFLVSFWFALHDIFSTLSGIKNLRCMVSRTAFMSTHRLSFEIRCKLCVNFPDAFTCF